MRTALRNAGVGGGAAIVAADVVVVAGRSGSDRREAAATAGTPADHVLAHGSAGRAGGRRRQLGGVDGRRRGDGSSLTQ